MDNNKFPIIVIILVMLFLVTPLAMNALREDPPAPAPAAAPAAAPGPAFAPPPGAPAAQAAPQAVQAPQSIPAMPAQSGLSAATLPGTAWQAPTPYGTVQIQLNPGGQLVANHPMVGSVPGTWSVSGNQVSGSATAMGQTIGIYAEIRGNNLWYQGRALKRLR
jgi:hypothetical protein